MKKLLALIVLLATASGFCANYYGSVVSVDSVATLTNRPPSSVNPVINVVDAYGNGYNARWRWVAGSTNTANGGTYLAVAGNTNGLYEIEGWDGDVRVFGAAGDGVTDDTVAVGAAVSYASGKPVKFPQGVYLLAPMVVTSFVKLEGDGAVFRRASGATSPSLTLGSGGYVKGITFDGNAANQTTNVFATASEFLYSSLYVTNGSLVVEDCTFTNSLRVSIQSRVNTAVRNSRFVNPYVRNSAAATSFEATYGILCVPLSTADTNQLELEFTGNSFIGTNISNAELGPLAIFITRDTTSGAVFENVRVSDNVFQNVRGGFVSYNGSKNGTASGNTLERYGGEGGIRIQRGENWTVIGNSFKDASTNVSAFGAAESLSYWWARENESPFNASGTTNQQIYNFIASGNTFLRPAGQTIAIRGNNALVSDNVIKDVQEDSNGISAGVYASGSHLTISGNRLFAPGDRGILVSGDFFESYGHTIQDADVSHNTIVATNGAAFNYMIELQRGSFMRANENDVILATSGGNTGVRFYLATNGVARANHVRWDASGSGDVGIIFDTSPNPVSLGNILENSETGIGIYNGASVEPLIGYNVIRGANTTPVVADVAPKYMLNDWDGRAWQMIVQARTNALEAFTVRSSDGTRLLRMDTTTGNLGLPTPYSSSLTSVVFNISRSQNQGTLTRIENNNTGTSAFAGLWLAALGTGGTSGASGYVNAWPDTFSIAQRADRVGIMTDSNAQGLWFGAPFSGQTINFSAGANTVVASIDENANSTNTSLQLTFGGGLGRMKYDPSSGIFYGGTFNPPASVITANSTNTVTNLTDSATVTISVVGGNAQFTSTSSGGTNASRIFFESAAVDSPNFTATGGDISWAAAGTNITAAVKTNSVGASKVVLTDTYNWTGDHTFSGLTSIDALYLDAPTLGTNIILFTDDTGFVAGLGPFPDELLGWGTDDVPTHISIGSGLLLSGGVLSATGSGGSATNATAVSVNGTYASELNLNGTTPTADPDYIAAEPKLSGTNLILQVSTAELAKLNTNNTFNGDVDINGTLSVDEFNVGLLILSNLTANTLLGVNSTGAVVSFVAGNGISLSGTNVHTKLAGTNTSHGTIGLSTNVDGTVVISLTSVTGGGAGTNAFANVPSIYGTAYFETTADDIVNDVYTGHISGSGSHVGDSMTTMELTINFDETRADTDYIVLWEVDTLNDLDGVSLIITNKSTTGFRIISAPITTPGTQPNGYAYTLTVIDTQGQSIAVTFTNIVAGDATIDNLVVTGAASVGTGLAVVGGLEVTGGIIADSITAPFAIVTNLATNSFVVVGSAGIVTNLPVTASRVAGTDGSGIPTLLSTTGSGNVMRTRTGVKRYVPIPMGSWLPGNVLPSTIATNLPTGGPPSDAWVFADAATNRNIVSFTIPPQWDGGTVRLYLKAVNNVANGSSQNYVWAFDAWAAGDGDVLTNNTWGTQVYSTNTIGTVAQTVSAFSSPAITIGNSPVVLDTVWIRLARWGDNASDGTNTVRLIDAMLEYTESATEYGGLP